MDSVSHLRLHAPLVMRNMSKILVAYGTRNGETAEVAKKLLIFFKKNSIDQLMLLILIRNLLKEKN